MARHAFIYDLTQNGTTFSDPDGDSLTYSTNVSRWPAGVTLSGTTMSGVVDAFNVFAVEVVADDGRGAIAVSSFNVFVAANSAPAVVKPNLALITSVGAHVNYDPTKGGSVFIDPDGDRLSYEVSATFPQPGLRIEGANVVGALNAVSVATFEVVARDDYGGSAVDRFSVAAAAAEPGEPTLPAVSHVYANEQLPLPFVFRSFRPDIDPYAPPPADNPTTNAGATLGRVLFYDKRLSITNTHSCASCHRQENGFAAPDRFSTGVQGLPLARNAIALGNSRFSRSNTFFADGRVRGLEALVLMPIKEPAELGNYESIVIARLGATDFYGPLFQAAFGTPAIDSDRISKAVAQFLRSLISYRSRFDRAYSIMQELDVPNPGAVLDAEELRGAEIFNSDVAMCSVCHDADVHTMGNPLNNGLDEVPTDVGAGGGSFRSGSLRNLAVTSPYMHDGRFATIRDVIDHYDHGVKEGRNLSSLLRDRATGQPLLLNLSEADKDALEAFLNTLTDDAFLNDPKFSDPFL